MSGWLVGGDGMKSKVDGVLEVVYSPILYMIICMLCGA